MATNTSTINIKAPVQKVWDALIMPDLVKQWQYGCDLVTNWAIGTDIKFRAEWERKVFEQWGKVLAFQPHTLIKYSLFAPRPGLEDKPENYFIMSYVLRDEKTHTQLEIIQEDNRPGAIQEKPQGEENPVLQALKKIAEAAS